MPSRVVLCRRLHREDEPVVGGVADPFQGRVRLVATHQSCPPRILASRVPAAPVTILLRPETIAVACRRHAPKAGGNHLAASSRRSPSWARCAGSAWRWRHSILSPTCLALPPADLQRGALVALAFPVSACRVLPTAESMARRPSHDHDQAGGQHGADGPWGRHGRALSRAEPGGLSSARGRVPARCSTSGPGTLARLAAAGVSHRDLKRVFVSHLHSDHVLDLVTLLQASNATPGWKREDAARAHRLSRPRHFWSSQLTAAFDGTRRRASPFRVMELGEERRDLGGVTLETALTAHTETSVAFRIEADGQSVVYSGDAIECPALTDLRETPTSSSANARFLAAGGQPTTSPPMAPAVWPSRRAPDVSCSPISTRPRRKPTSSGQARAAYDGEVIVAVDGTVVALRAR